MAAQAGCNFGNHADFALRYTCDCDRPAQQKKSEFEFDGAIVRLALGTRRTRSNAVMKMTVVERRARALVSTMHCLLGRLRMFGRINRGARPAAMNQQNGGLFLVVFHDFE